MTDLNQQLNEAQRLRENNQLDQAETLYQTILTETPNQLQALMGLGYVYRQKGQREQALAQFYQAEQNALENLWPKFAIIEELRDKRDFESAVKILNSLEEKHPQNFEIHFHKGHLYRAQQNREQAIIEFQQAIRLSPDSLWPQLALSEDFRDKRDFAAALAILDNIEIKYPDHVEIVLRRGLICRAQANLEQALTYFQKTVALNPNHLWGQLFLSEALRDKGDFEQSLNVLDKLEKSYPNHFEVILRKGHTYRAQGNREQALVYFQQAFQINSNNLWGILSLIDELRWHNDFNQALALLNEYLDKEPTNLQMLIRKAQTYRESGQREQALTEFQQALSIYPHDFQLNLDLAIELREQNKLEEALVKFENLEKNYPIHFQTLFHKAHCYRRQGQRKQALSCFQRALEIEPNNFHAHIAIIEELREVQQFDTAWKKLTELEQQHPQRFEVLFHKGHLYRAQSKHQLALEYFQQAALLNPTNLWGQLVLAEELRNQGDFEQAHAVLEKLENKQANNFHVLMNKGHLYRAQNQTQQALLCFQQAYAIDNSNIHALLQLANEQFTLGEINKAIAMLAQILTRQPTDLWTLIQMGNWLNIANAKKEALSYFQQALAAHPQQLQPYLRITQLLFDLGQRDEAFNLFNQAIEQCGERFEVYLHKSQMLWASREIETALQCLQQGLILFPDHYQLKIRQIEFLIQLGQFDEASLIIKNFLADNLDKKIQLQLFSAQIAERQWQLDKAIKIHQAILKQRDKQLASHEALRRLYMLKLDFAQAKYHASMLSRYRLGEQKINGQTGRGHLHDHIAQMTDEYLLNQPILEQVKQTLSLSPSQRLKTLAVLMQQEPEANSAANTFLAELRLQQYFAQGIPKRIFQYWDKPQPPAEVMAFTESWKTQNPDYVYQLFNEQSAREFLRDNYEANILKAYLRAAHAAQKADLLRLALLYKYGGIYADADDVCLKPLAQWLPQDAKLLFYQEEYATIGNNFIACQAQHSVIKQALDYATEALLRGDKDSIWLSTGPAMVSRALALYLAQNWSHATPKELGIVVITREELMQAVGIHAQLPYKATNDSWLIKEFKSGQRIDLEKLLNL